MLSAKAVSRNIPNDFSHRRVYESLAPTTRLCQAELPGRTPPSLRSRLGFRFAQPSSIWCVARPDQAKPTALPVKLEAWEDQQRISKIVQVIGEEDGVTTCLGLDPRASGRRHVASLATGRRLDRHGDPWEMTKPPS